MDSSTTEVIRGLSLAEVIERQQSGRTNVVSHTTGRTVWHIIRANVCTRINAVLGILCLLVLSTGSWINSLFGLLIIANSAIGIVQELRAKVTLERLKIMGETSPRVIREGEECTIPQEELVQDDIILSSSGEEILVDGVVISGEGMVDESQLTGESDSIQKGAGDRLISGSFVAQGSLVWRATDVGESAFIHRLTKQASEFSLTQSVLSSGINSIVKIITWLLIPTAGLTIYSQIFRSGAGIRDSILAMVAALVPMIPEGLILLTSVAFAAGVVRLGKYQALINELVAIEGLARVDVVCTDKTGTLTTNEMAVNNIQAEPKHMALLYRFLSAQSESNVTSKAIRNYVAEYLSEHSTQKGKDRGEERILSDDEVYIPLKGEEIPFHSARKYSALIVKEGEEQGVYILGAPDILSCEEDPILQDIREAEHQGFRVLIFGKLAGTDVSTPCDFLWSITVVLEQEIRQEAQATIDFFHKEGVGVKVISGDNADSVAAVARSVSPLLGEKVVDMHAASAIDVSADIFGRVSPDQKQDIISSLQKAGHTVAMTGDGINDILALKRADIGVAMGSGAPAARSVAQVVLLNNSFSSLPSIIAEGRRVIGNIERVATLFLTKTVYSVLLALAVGLIGVSFPFLPIHVTVTGWFTIGIPAFILSLAPNYERPREGFVPRVLYSALPSGILIALTVLGFWLWKMPSEDASSVERTQVSTAALWVLILIALFVLFQVARPLTWWKILLLGISISAYGVIFFTPISDFLLLDAQNFSLMMEASVVAGLGIVILAAVSVLLKKRMRFLS